MARRGTADVIPFERREVVEASAPQPLVLAPIELPRAPRPGWPTLAALGVAAGIAAVALGAWAMLDEAHSPGGPVVVDPAVGVLADSSAERYPLRGSVGRIALVVTADRDAVLALDGLGVAPAGTIYQAWLVPAGSATPVPDAAFDATRPAVPLHGRVASGDRVAVTLEQSPGADRPSRPLRLVTTVP